MKICSSKGKKNEEIVFNLKVNKFSSLANKAKCIGSLVHIPKQPGERENCLEEAQVCYNAPSEVHSQHLYIRSGATYRKGGPQGGRRGRRIREIRSESMRKKRREVYANVMTDERILNSVSCEK